MVTPSPLFLKKEGRKPWSVPRFQGKKEECGHGHPHASSRQKWFLPPIHCLTLLKGGWEGGHGHPKVTLNPSSKREEGRKPWSLPF